MQASSISTTLPQRNGTYPTELWFWKGATENKDLLRISLGYDFEIASEMAVHTIRSGHEIVQLT